MSSSCAPACAVLSYIASAERFHPVFNHAERRNEVVQIVWLARCQTEAKRSDFGIAAAKEVEPM